MRNETKPCVEDEPMCSVINRGHACAKKKYSGPPSISGRRTL
jgi:hypothetical protein